MLASALDPHRRRIKCPSDLLEAPRCLLDVGLCVSRACSELVNIPGPRRCRRSSGSRSGLLLDSFEIARGVEHALAASFSAPFFSR
jgi:hypothetical protein